MTTFSMRRIFHLVVMIFFVNSSSTTDAFGNSDSRDDNNEFYAERVDTTVQCSLDHTAIVTLYLEGDDNIAVLPGDQGFIRPTLPPVSSEHGDITGTHDLDWSQLFGNDESETQSPTMMNATTFISPANYSDGDNNITDFYGSGFNKSSVAATSTPGNGVEHRFRECWCAPFVLPTSYYRRQAFYCLEEFDTCQVHGRSGTIACFSSPKRTTFVRGFWPVCLFWYGALLYIFFASEQGQLARQYMKRGIFSFVYRAIGRGGQRRQQQNDNETNSTPNDVTAPQQQSSAVNNDSMGGTGDSENATPQSAHAQEAGTNTSTAQGNTNDEDATRSNTDDINRRMLEYELDRMRQDHPSRLSWLLQSAMARERNARWRQIRQLQLEQERQIRQEARDIRRQERQQELVNEEQESGAAATTEPAAAQNSNAPIVINVNPRGSNNSDDSDSSGSDDSTGGRPVRVRRIGPFTLGSASTRTDGTTRGTEASAFTAPPTGTPGLFSPALALAAFTTTRLQPTLSLKTKVFKEVSTVKPGQEESDEEDDFDEFDEFDDSSDDELEHDEESNFPSVASTASDTLESGEAQEKPIQLPKRKKRFPRCAICLVRVEIGDVVGDIACGHVFHKACM